MKLSNKTNFKMAAVWNYMQKKPKSIEDTLGNSSGSLLENKDAFKNTSTHQIQKNEVRSF